MKLHPGGTRSLGPKTTWEDSGTTQEVPALNSKDMTSDIRMDRPRNQIRETTYLMEAPRTGKKMLYIPQEGSGVIGKGLGTKYEATAPGWKTPVTDSTASVLGMRTTVPCLFAHDSEPDVRIVTRDRVPAGEKKGQRNTGDHSGFFGKVPVLYRRA